MGGKSRIGFIGTGVMGRSMAGHLLKAGYPLSVHNRRKEKAAELLAAGATWAGSPAEIAAGSEVIITIIGFPRDVEEVYLGAEGLVAKAVPGTCLIDMTTSSPELARRIYEAARSRGVSALDAPVSGGDRGAREARLSIMVGGEEAAFERVKPILEVMGQNVRLQGPAGSGQHTKMANQIAIAAGMLGVCEALAYARRSGLDPRHVLESISGGAAGSWSLSNLGPRMLAGDFAPGFYVKHFLKDMAIALNEARAMGLATPGLEAAKAAYEKLAEEGGADLGTQGLFGWYENHSLKP